MFQFCDKITLPREFRYLQISNFFEWYCGTEDLSHTSLQGFISAWRSYADEHHLFFPAYDSRELRRIQQSIRGAQLRYPREVRRDTPLTLTIIVEVAALLGVRRIADYNTCDPAILVFITRLLVAHQSCMRSIEHAAGCLVSDITFPDSTSNYIVFRVGEEVAARKIKKRPARLTILPRENHCMSGGTVLAILLRRCFQGLSGSSILFVDHVHGIQSTFAAPWQRHLAHLRRLMSRISGLTRAHVGRSSLRAGGATDWFAAGASREWVMQQGGWLSDAVDIYNRPTPASRYEQTPRLALGTSAFTQTHTSQVQRAAIGRQRRRAAPHDNIVRGITTNAHATSSASSHHDPLR